uniref:Uncharacterized protein n=1 Tax=Magallana gigas TaxID=29159 RepID=K1QNN2_MAGGI
MGPSRTLCVVPTHPVASISHFKRPVASIGHFKATPRSTLRKLDGYKFPVYTTTFCPRIKTEWNERSSALNCNKSNGYMCLPNDRFDELLEFCYREPVERIQKDGG